MSKATYTYGIDQTLYDFTDKEKSTSNIVRYFLNRTIQMFKYDGLPESIPARNLELMLQCNGNVAIAKVNDELYAFTGGLGGKPDAYYMPTIYTVANPALNISKNYNIDDDCIVIPNDSTYTGLLPMIRRYATALCETEISLKVSLINSRILSLVSAQDDATKASAEEFFRKIEKGELGVIGSNAFFEGLKAFPYNSTASASSITDLIEYEQYLKASLFNELGLNSNYNMKRESINSNEAQLNDDMLTPLIDDMLLRRQEALEKINEMFGTNITVEFNSAWKKNEIETDAELDMLESEVELTEAQADAIDDPEEAASDSDDEPEENGGEEDEEEADNE